MKLRKIRIETLQQYETSKKKQGFRITNNKKIIENKDNNNNHNSVVYYDWIEKCSILEERSEHV